MSVRRPMRLSPRMRAALDELQAMIHGRFPTATFAVAQGEDDPEAVHLRATVDVEDADLVTDLVVDRLVELQVDEGQPVYVIPLRPIAKVAQAIQAPAAQGAGRSAGAALIS